MPQLHVLTGRMGAGKSTRAAQLLSQGDWQVVSFDDTREAFQDFDASETQKRIIAAVHVFLQAGHNVVVDACNLHEHDYIRWETVAICCGAELIWEPIDTPAGECALRVARRDGVAEMPAAVHSLGGSR